MTNEKPIQKAKGAEIMSLKDVFDLEKNEDYQFGLKVGAGIERKENKAKVAELKKRIKWFRETCEEKVRVEDVYRIIDEVLKP